MLIARALLDVPPERSPMRPFVVGLMRRLNTGLAREHLIAGMRAAMAEQDVAQRVTAMEAVAMSQQAEHVAYQAEVSVEQRATELLDMGLAVATAREALATEARTVEAERARTTRAQWAEGVADGRARAASAECGDAKRQALEAEVQCQRRLDQLLVERGQDRARSAELDSEVKVVRAEVGAAREAGRADLELAHEKRQGPFRNGRADAA
ncbi:MAG: hypothetical protein GY772_23835 [bacterium]|nr:hypothetical protein [bacterium]